VVHVWGAARSAGRPTERERAAVLAYRLDLNLAHRAELLQLPGVGPSLAERIEGHRREHGPFRRVEDLAAVRGIGPAMLERLRPLVCVRGDEMEEETERSTLATRRPPARTDPASKAPGRKEASLTGLIDVNQAPADELQRLPGIGPKMAQRILDER